MNIDWVIACRYVEVHDNLGTLVGAGLDTFWVPTVPHPVQVLLASRLVGLPDEFKADIQHTVRSIVTNGRGEEIAKAEGTLGMEAESARPDYLTGVILPSVVVFEAQEEGTYMLEVIVDDASTSLPIHVVVGQPGS